ncbi:S1C family serine protease [Ralstonia insidiosa]|uniref:Peptidase S1 n=1 Tax=Ralstonia insidiosa TaxID=190721 RepID=A0A192A0S8_9RALS|nr:S1C family serine protease [Ralstonia insidiosa]ANJ73989.1 peptidase S1 [Ralstonia insidiosa]KAB0471197.1 serine protease [Ralstonia insidiosa]MBY4909283.1 S1C family serine protease [Ralstonia insidiosa]
MSRTALILRACLAAAAALSALPATALEPADVFAKVAPSIWEVLVADATGRPTALGSAVVIGDGLAITNCHVLRGGKQVNVKRGNATFGARLLYPDVERDLCQLRIADFHYPAVTIAPSSMLVTGQKVYAIGNPLGFDLTISEGLISSLRHDENGQLRAIQTSAAISQGSSGGGLFDSNARLVGITSRMVSAAYGQNLNFAAPADWINDVPARAQKALAERAAAQSAAKAAAAATPSGTTPADAAPRKPGELGPKAQAGFAEYLRKPWPKVFVAADGDEFIYQWGQNAEFRAVSWCKERYQNCSIYARDDTVVEGK